MATKAFIVVAIFGFLALAHADPIRSPRKPVGECPPKNGAVPTYLPDSDNCAIFYECESGEPIQKECMEGLCFDTRLNVCAFPPVIAPLSAVGTCPPRDTNITVYLPDSDNCTIYYVCSNGHPIQNVCPPDMSWNAEKNICDWDIDAGCNTVRKIQTRSAVGKCPEKDGAIPVFLPDDQDNTIYYECSNGVAIENVCPPGQIWNTKLNTCDWPKPKSATPLSAVGECPSKDGWYPVYLPDDQDNTIYYECSNGVPIKNYCTAGLVWDTQLNTCNRPQVESVAPFAAVGKCPPRDTNTTVYLTDSESCAVYYVCSNGQPIKLTCPPAMAWNAEKNVCDWEIDTNCELSRKKSVRKPVGECPEKDPANPVYLPDDEDCTVYYECSNGLAVENVCPPDMHFNPTLHVCDDPLNAGCKADGSTSSTESSSTDSSTTEPSTTGLPTTTRKAALAI